MGYGKEVRVKDILSDAAARGIVARYVPEITNSPMFEHVGFVPFRALVERGSTAPPDPDRLEEMWHELGLLEGSPRLPAAAPAIAPALDYEPAEVPRGSARISPVGPAEQWGITELVIEGPSHGNPFTDVELSAEFTRAEFTSGTAGSCRPAVSTTAMVRTGYVSRRPGPGPGPTSRRRPPGPWTACGVPSR